MLNYTFTERPLTLDDAQKFVETRKVISAALGTNRVYSAEFIQSQWQEPAFDITYSSLGIFADDQLAGYVVLWDTNDTPVRPWVEWGVHPDFVDYNLDERIFQWADKTAQRVIDRCPPKARISLQTNTIHGYTPEEKALEKAGYVEIRNEYEMRIDMDSEPVVPPIPDGFSIRNYRHSEDLPEFVNAFRDSFSDIFGYVDESFETKMADFAYWFENDELFDPSVFFLAIDDATQTVAGFVFGIKHEHGDASVGYIEHVGIRRDYRRRGLAQTLLFSTFKAYWMENRKSVTLGVDGKSLTGAVKLYERVGMYIRRQIIRYEKVIRDGDELATVKVD